MKSSLVQKLGIRHPVFQAPMAGGIVSPDFVAQVSSYGMLGAIPSGYLSISQTREFIEEVKQRTHCPFSLNLFVDYMAYGETPIQKPNEIIALERAFRKEVSTSFQVVPPPEMDDFIQLVLECKVPIVSTAFGLLAPTHVAALKAAGVAIMTTINSVYEIELALKTQLSDVLIYQNALAGGHKGGFTSLPHSDESAILEALGSHAGVHCVLAGAIVDKSDIATTLEKGFDGVQIGTAFLATQESTASESYKLAILQGCETDFTDSITGKVARGLKNPLSCLALKDNLGFPYMHYATAPLRKMSKESENISCQSLWCGDGVSKINTIPTLGNFMENLI